MKKAIFFDVDGTMVDTFNGSREISPAVRTAIKALQAAGHYVFVATGRPYAFISEMLWEFGFDGFVLSNGAQVIMNDKVIYSGAMDHALVDQLAAKLSDNNIQYVLEGGHDSYIHPKDDELFEFCKSLGISEQLIKRDYQASDIDVYKIEVLCKDRETESQCANAIKEYPDYDYYYSINGEFLEIYAKKNNKAKGIEKALEYLEIDIAHSYAFGDGMNDIEMLEAVGCGFAMGNASDEVKGYADRVIDTVGNDGVATAIYQYILETSVEDAQGNIEEEACS